MSIKDNITCKVVLVGESGVGKTSIINRYINNDFNENEQATLGPIYKNKVIQYPKYNKSISFDIWDTAGQEKYRSVTKNFYVNAGIGIMVYDIRVKDSFENIKTYWSEQLQELGEENIILAIAGNKCDLFEEQNISDKEVKKFAKSINAVFQLTSCKESIGIDELFKQCGQKYLEMNNLIETKQKDKIVLGNDKGKNNNQGKKKKCC